MEGRQHLASRIWHFPSFSGIFWWVKGLLPLLQESRVRRSLKLQEMWQGWCTIPASQSKSQLREKVKEEFQGPCESQERDDGCQAETPSRDRAAYSSPQILRMIPHGHFSPGTEKLPTGVMERLEIHSWGWRRTLSRAVKTKPGCTNPQKWQSGK